MDSGAPEEYSVPIPHVAPFLYALDLIKDVFHPGHVIL
jgi:hypothetical protein